MDFPIEINDVDNLVGWGYWLGLGQDDLQKYKTLAQSDNEKGTLISFIKSELSISENHTYLPRAEQIQMCIYRLKKLVDPPSLNTAKNYGYFSCEDSSPPQKAKNLLG